MSYESSAERLLGPLPAFKFMVWIEIIREEKPLNELIGSDRPRRWYQKVNVERLVALDATAETPLHARLAHQCV